MMAHQLRRYDDLRVQGHDVHIIKGCRRQRELLGAQIVAMRRGEVPLVNLKCGSFVNIPILPATHPSNLEAYGNVLYLRANFI